MRVGGESMVPAAHEVLKEAERGTKNGEPLGCFQVIGDIGVATTLILEVFWELFSPIGPPGA